METFQQFEKQTAKKSLFLITLVLLFYALACALSGCAVPTFEAPARTHVSTRGNPRFGKFDKVYNLHNGHTYIIDSVMRRPDNRKQNQVFYAAHDVSGEAVRWLCEKDVTLL